MSKKNHELPIWHPLEVIRDWEGGDAFRIADAQSGVVCFGATGSGKTSGPAKSLAHGYLASEFGGLVLCAKKEERQQWEEWADSTDRWKDLVIIDKSGDSRFNFLDWEASRPGEGGGITINIVALLDEIAGAIGGGAGQAEGGSGDNKFFEDALHHMNTNLVDLPVLAGAPVTLPLMRTIVNSSALSLDDLQTSRYTDGACARFLLACDRATASGQDEAARADFEECRNYWEKEWPTLSDKTRSIIQISFSMLARPLLTRPLRQLFCTDTTITPEAMFDGKIIIVDLPVQEFRLAGRIANLIWKYCSQIAILRRPPPKPGSYLRPVFLWADEYQNFASKFDSEWAAVARSASGCTTFLVQNRESLLRVLGNAATVDSLLGNLQAKFFCQNTGDTNEWASKSVLGEHWTDITGISINRNDAGTSSGTNLASQQRRFVDSSTFAKLRRGGPKHNFLVDCIVYNGGSLFPFSKSVEALRALSVQMENVPARVPYQVITYNQKIGRKPHP